MPSTGLCCMFLLVKALIFNAVTLFLLCFHNSADVEECCATKTHWEHYIFTNLHCFVTFMQAVILLYYLRDTEIQKEEPDKTLIKRQSTFFTYLGRVRWLTMYCNTLLLCLRGVGTYIWKLFFHHVIFQFKIFKFYIKPQN